MNLTSITDGMCSYGTQASFVSWLKSFQNE